MARIVSFGGVRGMRASCHRDRFGRAEPDEVSALPIRFGISPQAVMARSAQAGSTRSSAVGRTRFRRTLGNCHSDGQCCLWGVIDGRRGRGHPRGQSAAEKEWAAERVVGQPIGPPRGTRERL
jgi:hypothetical protein